jgi:hypothetical protein
MLIVRSRYSYFQLNLPVRAADDKVFHILLVVFKTKEGWNY